MDSRTVMERVVAAFNTGNLSEVEEIFAPTYIDHQRPAWLQVDGPEEFKQIVENARRALPGLHVTIEDVIATPAAVAGRLRWYSVDIRGRALERETIEILHLAQGQIVEHWGAEAWARTADEG